MGLRVRLTALALLASCAHTPSSRPTPHDPGRTFHTLVTGNGHGFQLFDENRRRLDAFFDHPYRFVRAPEDRKHDGPEHRNLIEDFSLGLVHDGTASWLESWPAELGYLRETNIIEADAGSTGKAY